MGTHDVHRTNEVIQVIVINPRFAFGRMGKRVGITSGEKEVTSEMMFQSDGKSKLNYDYIEKDKKWAKTHPSTRSKAMFFSAITFFSSATGR